MAIHGDALARYFERVSSQLMDVEIKKTVGSLSHPASFDKTPKIMQDLFGGASVERASLLGIRTAEMHLALASQPEEKDFQPEPFSLHYQRSLFSSLQSLVRGTFQNLSKNIKKLPEELQEEANEILGMKKDILNCLRMIYAKKIDAMKIRTHGDYHLGQVLFTGKDFVILDFEGEPARSYSERRIKRSPLRDVSGMIRSFHYAAYNAFFQMDIARSEQVEILEQWAEQWYHYMSGFYIKAYLETTQGSEFIPNEKEDLNVLLQTFLLEKAIYELNYELNNRPSWVIIPIQGIKSIMKAYFHEESKRN